MGLAIVSGTANPALAEMIARTLEVRPVPRIAERFPDAELHVEIGASVRGDDVYIVQPTSPPGDEHLVELLFLADACRRAGAGRLTAVVPYLGYARQDRRARGREPVGARLVADLIVAAGFHRVVAVDLHAPAIEGFFALPVEHLSAVTLLAEAARPHVGANGVVVAPDIGAAKLADRCAKLLGLPVAIVHKTRLSGSDVSVRSVTGDVRGRSALVIDDMITTGGTIEAAVRSVLAAGAKEDVVVAASHGLFVGPAIERLRALPVLRFIVTDSVAPGPASPLPLEVVSLGPLLAAAVDRLHHDRSLGDLSGRG